MCIAEVLHWAHWHNQVILPLEHNIAYSIRIIEALHLVRNIQSKNDAQKTAK